MAESPLDELLVNRAANVPDKGIVQAPSGHGDLRGDDIGGLAGMEAAAWNAERFPGRWLSIHQALEQPGRLVAMLPKKGFPTKNRWKKAWWQRAGNSLIPVPNCMSRPDQKTIICQHGISGLDIQG